ncbi:MAG: hypothetical protein IJV31_07425 [Clostridia bacterium]|nr:hypothetical protein [Clostridia bacterium]
MKQIDKQAVSEVIEILKHSEQQIMDKIPRKFIDFLNENTDKEYKAKINFNDEKWDESIKEDTKAILALIYRDYIVSKEERNKLLEEEQKQINKQQQELYEKYNPDNIFKKKVDTSQKKDKESINNMQLIEIKEEIWFKKIWKKIISFLGKNKI